MKPIRSDLPNNASPQDHVDDVRFVVRFTGVPTGDVRQVTGGIVAQWDAIGVPLEEAARLATAVAWDEDAEVFHPFVASQRYSQFEWGASGSSLEFAIDLLNNVSSELVLLGMGYAVSKIRGRKRQRVFPGPDDLEGLRGAAIETTSAVFDVPRDDLEVTEAKLRERSAVLRLRSGDDSFVAKLGELNTGDACVIVYRE